MEAIAEHKNVTLVDSTILLAHGEGLNHLIDQVCGATFGIVTFKCMQPVPHLQKGTLHSLGINYDFLESKEAVDYLEYDFIIDVEVFHGDVDVVLLDLGRFD